MKNPFKSSKIADKTEVDGKDYYTYSRGMVRFICIGFAVSYALFLLLKLFDMHAAAIIPVTISMILVFVMAHSWYLNNNVIAATTQFRIKNENEIHAQRQELLEREYQIRHKYLLRELGLEEEDSNIIQ